MNKLISSFLFALALVSVAHAQVPQPTPEEIRAQNQDPRARKLLDEAKAKLQSIDSLVVAFETPRDPTEDFKGFTEIRVERPNRFRVGPVDKPTLVCDGVVVSQVDQGGNTMNARNFVAFDKKARPENFFLGVNFLVQFFFDPRGIAFDPTDGIWNFPVSQFDTNLSAYDRDTKLTLVGQRTRDGQRCDVVEIKYNTKTNDIRQQIYIGQETKLVYRVDSYFDGALSCQKFNKYRINEKLPPETWRLIKPERMPTVDTDPVRLGEVAPDFKLPTADGGEISLKDLLKDKKGVFVCVLNSERPGACLADGADRILGDMRLIQDAKDKFEAQGLAVVCILGGNSITPDVKEEMLTNWVPDLARFNYPVAIDIDIERGIQGSAYQNFQLDGRNNLLLDSKGRVVFAARSLGDKINQISFYQALIQLGFSVSPNDLQVIQ